jgi:lactococcin 972 family bacteriocin
MKLKSIVAGAASAGALVLSAGVGPAVADHYVGGGYWDYGFCQGGDCGTGGIVYSHYQHYSATHKATACNKWDCDYAGWHAPTYEAQAAWPMTMWGNTAYWGTK